MKITTPGLLGVVFYKDTGGALVYSDHNGVHPVDHDRGLPPFIQDQLNDTGLHMMPLEYYKTRIAEFIANGVHEHSLKVREILIETLKGEVTHDFIDEILKACGFPVQKQTWTVTAYFDGNEVEVPVTADSKEQAIEIVAGGMRSTAEVTFTFEGSDGCSYEMYGELDDPALDDIDYTATQDI